MVYMKIKAFNKIKLFSNRLTFFYHVLNAKL